MSNFVPSQYQTDIFNFIQTSNKNLFIEACAGSGKTTTLVKLVQYIMDSNLTFLAFNKNMAEELKKKLPGNVRVKTTHALGLTIWSSFTGERPTVSGNKVDNIIDDEILTNTEYKGIKTDIWLMRGVIKGLVSLAKLSGYKDDTGKRHLIDNGQLSLKNILEQYELNLKIADKYNIDIYSSMGGSAEDRERLEQKTDIALKIAEEILEINNSMRDVIDFDDMIYFPYIFSDKFPTLRTVLCDEVQDFSLIQLELLKLCMNKNSRIIGVGDRMQAIYRWRGAGENSVEDFVNHFQCEIKRLPVTYRCPVSVVELSQIYNPGIIAREDAPEGTIRNLKDKWNVSDYGSEDMFLSFYNYPLLKVALKFVEKNKSVCFVGKDITEDVKFILKLIKEERRKDFEPKLDEWYTKRVKSLQLKALTTEVTKLKDSYFSIKVLLKRLDRKDRVEKILDTLKEVFSSKRGVKFSTIHKAKGTESKRVILINHPIEKPESLTQEERNLNYVAITRAIETLHFITVEVDG